MDRRSAARGLSLTDNVINAVTLPSNDGELDLLLGESDRRGATDPACRSGQNDECHTRDSIYAARAAPAPRIDDMSWTVLADHRRVGADNRSFPQLTPGYLA
jgi:hypothetical protein